MTAKKQGAVDLTVGSPLKKIVLFTLPLLLGSLFQLCYSWTDAIILGKVAGDAVQFSALSASMPIPFLLLTVVNGFLAGAVVVIGQLFGGACFERLKKSFSTLLISLVVMAGIFTVIGYYAAEPMLRLIRVDDAFIPYSKNYLQIYFLGCIFMVLYNTLASVLRSLGNSTVPLLVLVFCVILNIGLDLVFVVNAKMGTSGVAIGTILAQAVSVIVLAVYIRLRVPILHLGKKEIVFDKPLFFTMLRLGVPSMIQDACAGVGYMVINTIVNSQGAEFTSAFAIGNRIDEMLSATCQSFGTALTTFSAQNRGKGDIKRIRTGFKNGMVVMTASMLAVAGFIYLLRDKLISLFINLDASPILNMEKVLSITNTYLSIYLPFYVLMAWMVVTAGVIRGAGAAKQAMTVNIFSFALRVTSALVYSSISAYGIFFASPTGWLAGTVWALVLYFKGKWQHIEIEKREG